MYFRYSRWKSIDNLRQWVFLCVRFLWACPLTRSLMYFSSKTTFHTGCPGAKCCLSIAVWYYIGLFKWLWMLVAFCGHKGLLLQKPHCGNSKHFVTMEVLYLPLPLLSGTWTKPAVWQLKDQLIFVKYRPDQNIRMAKTERATLHHLLPVSEMLLLWPTVHKKYSQN